MSQKILPAHSLTEVHFYLMLQRCGACQQARLSPQAPRHHFLGQQPVCTVSADCRDCGSTTDFHFATAQWSSGQLAEAGGPEALPTVNPTPRPSELIDLAQWLTLFRVIVGQASRTSDRQDARRLGYEAALCLEEALKFYPPESDLPPPEAFFTPLTKQRFREHPAQFARSQLLTWRERLPSLSRMRQVIQQSDRSTGPRSRRWWRRRKP